jgi:deazaflavin-dependent oxidoreductase (nitroreductase family)
MPLTGEYAPSPFESSRKQAETFEASGGADAATLHGTPIILLTSIGAKSGRLRKNPLMRVEHDGRYAVVASKGGADTNPGWYHNLVKNPHVEVQDGAEKHDYLAHEAQGDEREQWWARALEVWPDYAQYQTKTDRIIPVFVLTPIDG